MNCELTPLGKLLAVTLTELPGFAPPMVTPSCACVPSCAATTVLEDSDIVSVPTPPTLLPLAHPIAKTPALPALLQNSFSDKNDESARHPLHPSAEYFRPSFRTI